MKRHHLTPTLLATATLFVFRMEAASSVDPATSAAPPTVSPPARDPGVRTGVSVGQPLLNLTVAKQTLGIVGRPNIVLTGNAISGQPNFNGNDGTAARFGWKAQNKSLLLFSGEAYNVEMEITSEARSRSA